MGVCVTLVLVLMTQINKYITLLLYLHDLSCLFFSVLVAVSCGSVSEGMRTFIGKLKRWSPLEVQKVESSLWTNVFVFYRFSCAVMEVLYFRRYKIGLIKLVVVTCVSLHYTIMWKKIKWTRMACLEGLPR